ncbi:MAG: hypothetical protein WBA23_15350 [Tunicatimonas sp.]|uniref:hypothetical protein n=1 Tax=Tunicatimonas sp. TaxID=1940096 RepID=UPI003C7659F3
MANFRVFVGKVKSTHIKWLLGILVTLGLGIASLPYWSDKSPPLFRPAYQSVRPDSIVLLPNNDAAREGENIIISFQGYRFPAIEPDESLSDLGWRINFDNYKFLKDFKFEQSRNYYIQVGFEDEGFSDSVMVVINLKPPTVLAEIEDDSLTNGKIVRGIAASATQLRQDTVKVNVIYHVGDVSQQVSLSPQYIYDQDRDLHYFKFETQPIEGLPIYSSDDPEYTAPFFEVNIIDQTGYSFAYKCNYATYIAPGPLIFEGGSISEIVADTRISIEELSSTIPSAEFYIYPKGNIEYTIDGKPAIVIEATESVGRKDEISLHWQSSVPDKKPITLVFRNDQQIAGTLNDQYTDTNPPKSELLNYRVEQQGNDGIVYSSGIVEPISCEVKHYDKKASKYVTVEAFSSQDLSVRPEEVHNVKIVNIHSEPIIIRLFHLRGPAANPLWVTCTKKLAPLEKYNHNLVRGSAYELYILPSVCLTENLPDHPTPLNDSIEVSASCSDE